MESLKDILKSLGEAKKLASVDLEAWDWRSRASMAITVNEAKERLESLFKQYNAQIAERSLGIFVLGPKAEEFAKLAEAEGGTITVRADAVYRKIVESIEPYMPDSGDFGVIQFGRLTQALVDLGHELGIKVMDVPRHRLAKTETKAALISLVRDIVRETFEDDLNRLYVMSLIEKRAFDANFSGTVLPVVVIGLTDAQEAKGLTSAFAKFGTQVVTDTDTEVTKESVLEVFNSVKERLKPKKKSGNTLGDNPDNKQ